VIVRYALLLLSLTGTVALADSGRPLEALDADRAAAEADVHDLERRVRLLDQQLAERRAELKRRLRAMCRLSSGGYLRLLAEADSPEDLRLRSHAAARSLARDLGELRAVRDEAAELDVETARRTATLVRAVELDGELGRFVDEPPVGLATKKGRLERPVRGPVLAGFGRYRDPETHLERARRGVEMDAHPGETVRAVADGEVRWSGDVPGLGRGLLIDHGDGYLTLLALLRDVRVVPGQRIAAAAPLGEAAGRRVYLELTQRRTPLDPAPWLTPP
jgi:septal ring factor EnvC (AmiA/AmiB activator)